MIANAVQRFSRKRSAELQCDTGTGGKVKCGRHWRKIGPTSLKEAFQMHERVLADLRTHRQGDVLHASLCNHFSNGIQLFTEFSGIDAPAQCLHGLASTLLVQGEIETYKIDYVSACDNSASCRQVLLALPEIMRPHHLGLDILDRIPEDTRKEISKMAASARGSPAGELTANFYVEQILEALKCCGMASELPQMCALHHGGGGCGCQLLRSELGADGKRRSVRVVVAGITCTDFSYAGSKRGLQGESLMPILTFIWSRLQGLDDLIFIEEAPAFSKVMMPLLQSTLGGIYHIESVVMCPSEIGWPMTRKRSFLRLAHRQKTRRVCAFSKSELSAFLHTVEMTGDDFFTSELHAKPAPRTRIWSKSTPDTEVSLAFLSEADRARYMGQLLRSDMVTGGCNDDANLTPIFNIHRTAKMSRPTRLLPSLTKRSRVLSATHKRVLCGMEHLAAMGVAVWPQIQIPSACPVHGSFDHFSDRHLKEFAGNTMNTNIMSMVLAFGLAGVELELQQPLT